MFFGIKNCTVSHFTIFSAKNPFAMCLLDFYLESMNYSCFLGDKSDALRLDEKQHGGTKQWTRSPSRFYIPAVLT